ncbi:amino acid transporter [Slackia heliotrinireducens]|uniref:Amino acid transporter n=1 Tax=Slackia heliotrinireducens (strain ATCC 29202 / DSM 20476 / NCTC 11029 / RHS 1) TaxID=471855 RepID=C7N1A7_SLAHD|nr:APC family permease [Slackia heliotrinireducens]ACV23329.1 amino acid transporter [Slackia heliotrinireducens DSM 20476]VEH02547.1 amino acid transporter [Slackia heliotrinireducens]
MESGIKAEPLVNTGESNAAPESQETEMARTLFWKQVVFLALGAPALVLFNMGGVSSVMGAAAPLAWALSVIIGVVQCVAYVEIAGMHPSKTGGISVYGATAWMWRYPSIGVIPPWSHWVAWIPILPIGVALAASYLMNLFIPADSILATWQITLLDLGFIQDGLTLRISLRFIIAALLMVIIVIIQIGGVASSAKTQIIMSLCGIVPLLVIVIVPLLTGGFHLQNFNPFVPVSGAWDGIGLRAFFGAVLLAAWASYGSETAACYMCEMKRPSDAPKAMFVSGGIAIVLFILVPVVFQGCLGTEYMLRPDINSGEGVGAALASMVSSNPVFCGVVVVMLVFTLMLGSMTAMADTARTLYQGGKDGTLPKFLAHANKNGSPSAAIWFNFVVDLILLLFSDYLFLLAITAMNYILCHFFVLTGAWIHRMDNPDIERPYKISDNMLTVCVLLAFFNMFLVGAGSNVWGSYVLPLGIVLALVGMPLYWFRHYVVDKGQFPEGTWQDLIPKGLTEPPEVPGSIIPKVCICLGIVFMLIGYIAFYVML